MWPVLVALTLAPAACRRGPGKAEVPTGSGAAPHLKLAEGRFELRPVVQDEPVQRLISLANKGSLPLEIKAIEASRFCSASINPKIIAPGARGQLEVTCRSDLYGPLREVLLLHTNDPSAEKIPIELVATVTPRLAFDASVVDLEMRFGEERSQEVRLVGTMVGKAAVRLKRSAVGEDSSITPLPGPKGWIEGYRILCKGKKVGTHSGNLFVSTGLPSPKEIAMPYACKVKGTLEVFPTNPYFNMKVPGPKVVPITIRSSQPGFEVRGATVVEGPFAASVEGPSADGSYRVDVKVREERVKQDGRGAVGTLVVLSNDRTEPRKEIPLFGFGKMESAKSEATAPGP